MLMPILLWLAIGQPHPADIGAALAARPAVSRAIDWVREHERTVLDDQIRLCEIEAPPFQEARRGDALRHLFQSLGLRQVRVDHEGNVIGERPGRSARPNIVLSAHLDTVFPEGTDVTVRRDGVVLRGPGIGDDCRGLAVLAGVIRGLDAQGTETAGTLTFVGTVGEEGLGDLRGVKHLFDVELKDRIDAFVSIDGAGTGITHVGVGSHRYRVTFGGPGGHSYGAFGQANPVHALGRLVGAIADFQVPGSPVTTFNVGRVGGGTSVNSIAFEAWMEVDLRSADADALGELDQQFRQAVEAALAAENRRWSNRGSLSVSTEVVGRRAAGRTPRDSAIVSAAVSVTRALGLPVTMDEGSTDSNHPMALGIPAITIDGGGSGRGAHSLHESFDTTDSWKGTARALLLALALTGMP
jgi:tripeptide aminopeptidase